MVQILTRLNHLFERSVDHFPTKDALIVEENTLSYAELDHKANKLAHYLIKNGVNEDCSIGLLLERSSESFIAMLAVLKAGASYVTLDIDCPSERLAYINEDMQFPFVISTKKASEMHPNLTSSYVLLDKISNELLLQSETRPVLTNMDSQASAYTIYTSGSTGKPKGVRVCHAAIMHYVAEASSLYKMTSADRVYQGFSLTFDASLEEIWMAFANAATLIVASSKDTRSGIGLVEFINEHHVSVFSTVPTLLSTLEGRFETLRLLILGGEACTPALIQRWSREGLTIYNTYGPTEACVIATACKCLPGKMVNIGKPLPGYELLVLDEHLCSVAQGQQGELCIAGKALATEYINQPVLTAKAFVPHPLKASERLYRTGDLVKENADGTYDFLGRIDSQVKLRGFRVELAEIESVLQKHSSIRQAVITLDTTRTPTLVAYVSLNQDQIFQQDILTQMLRQQLPDYMIPQHYHLMENFPLLTSGKVDRKNLPSIQFNHEDKGIVPAETLLEKQIADQWEKVLQISSVSIDAHFFYDLGGHSLSAANIVSSLRRSPGFETLSILDLYQHPTIRELAKATEEKTVHLNTASKPADERNLNTASKWAYALCAVGQGVGILMQFAFRSWQLLFIILCYAWISAHSTNHPIQAIGGFFVVLITMPWLCLGVVLAAKWTLIGRFKPGKYRVWSWFYLRWWFVERLQKSLFPSQYLIGSPLIVLYYRLLGAKIGKNCFIGTTTIGTHDLISIGDNSSIGYNARLLGYIVENGWLTLGTITIKNNCFIGARSVLSIDTSVQTGGQLEDMSLLPAGKIIPQHHFYSGSPGKQTPIPEDHIVNQEQALLRDEKNGFGYGLLHYIALLLIMSVYYACYLPALYLVTTLYAKTNLFLSITVGIPLAASLFLSMYYLSLVLCKKVLLNRLKPGTYPVKSLYYLRQWMLLKLLDQNEISILADTLYFPVLLRRLGAKIGKHVEIGETPHLIPDLLTIEEGGFSASYVALAWPSTHLGWIRFLPVEIGRRGFVGNSSLLAGGNQIGEQALLGCLSLSPAYNQAAKPGTAWLGSPAVFLPRREIIQGFSEQEKYTPPKRLVLVRLLIEAVRILLPSALTLLNLFLLLTIINSLIEQHTASKIAIALPFVECLITLGFVGLLIGLKWILIGKLKPDMKPIWNIFIWKNDLIEYLYYYYITPNFTDLILGTPFVAILLRLFGAKIGKHVFINSPDFTEFDLVSIGSETSINAESIIQTHLYEDRIFKMGTIDIHHGCNLGTASVILYNTTMEAYSALGNLSLLMKGEHLPNYTQWQGVPAQPMGYYNPPPRSQESDLLHASWVTPKQI